jgi:hypothetical protein
MSNAMPVPWKELERTTAKVLGGTRLHRGADFGRRGSDVEHSLFVIECKYRKALPKFLAAGLAQARRGDPTKVPLLVLKERQQRGSLVVLSLADFVDLLGPLTPAAEATDGPLATPAPGTLPD